MKFENVIIFGLGAAGSNTLLNLMRDLPEVNFFGVDYDKVEERNFRVGTQPYNRSHLGKFKTQAMQLICMSAGQKLFIFNKKIEKLEDLLEIINKASPKTTPLIIDAFDKAEYRNLIGQLKKNFKIPVAHIGFSPLKNGSIIWDDVWQDIDNDLKKPVDICAMQGARSFIMALTSIASMSILDYYYNHEKKSLYFDSYFKLRKL
ncbi:MAG: hypothetical protein JETCAE03_35880 [Ignavibacteriaceae bacterium]|nr:MAG: hypothetical protein JETCAE03_35880 [Ignavibacteriaceae bacterium]